MKHIAFPMSPRRCILLCRKPDRRPKSPEPGYGRRSDWVKCLRKSKTRVLYPVSRWLMASDRP
ncbi:protein of unknown function (plasmid) [Cupriavidus taiwanensis]|uniref:Uncharacterized protein n=1 Tax=Cupriavidus taiwanensis TaxID=164546 RepID=A0A9Q7V2G2_9BURK|nr:protein of unknown function [Cupriavidus taiwanensis]